MNFNHFPVIERSIWHLLPYITLKFAYRYVALEIGFLRWGYEVECFQGERESCADTFTLNEAQFADFLHNMQNPRPPTEAMKKGAALMAKFSAYPKPQRDPNECQHAKCQPAWDAEKAKGMDEREIRKVFPRFDGVCPDCKERVIVYASFEQYIGGDY